MIRRVGHQADIRKGNLMNLRNGYLNWLMLVTSAIVGMFIIGEAATAWGQAEPGSLPREQYARELIEKAKLKDVEFKLVAELNHPEAFRILQQSDGTVVEAASLAGWVYGAVALAEGETQPGMLESPDFDLRGTTLWLAGAVKAGRMVPYYSRVDAVNLPWFFDRRFMTRYLDSLVLARYNTLFLWSSHPFPYILELPAYPGATELTTEQLRRNQEQFRWLTSQCARRNIRVLLHFYNIHLPDALAEKFKAGYKWGASAVKKPTPDVARYYRYVLGRYFDEFDSVGLYICPGETLDSAHQLEWFRDVIFAAAHESGKNPLLVIRDWTMNMEFRSKIRSLYENCYSELKHNDESFTSPVPDRRHRRWRDVLKGHIVNLHGPPMDLQPMRWGSPILIQETVDQWRKLGFVKGAEIYALSCFDWPRTQDKIEPDQFGYREEVQGRTLLSLDRDYIHIRAFGRYLWQVDRDPEAEQAFWEGFLGRKFRSEAAGKAIYQWYVRSGPISPGIQNLTATKFGNFWAAVMLQNQTVDLILNARSRIDDVPITLTRETGRTKQVYYSQPMDAYFIDRYRAKYRLENLKQRVSMPVSQYATELAAGRTVSDALTPDKVCDLLCELAAESFEAAEAAYAAASDSAIRGELGRFVTDSRMYLLATEALRHKVQAAILKVRMLRTSDTGLAREFQEQMEQSVVVYEKLAKLTDATYRHGNDLMRRHWKREGLAEFRDDLAFQMAWLDDFRELVGMLPAASVYVEAETMTGPWRTLPDDNASKAFSKKHEGFLGTGYKVSNYAQASSKPSPIVTRVQIPARGEYTVWVRALVGGAEQDRALAVEIAGKRLAPTHVGTAPEQGAFTWERSSRMELSTGSVELKIHPVGKYHPTADAVVLVPDANWKPQCYINFGLL
jgi:hypothetical protein